MKDKYKYLTKNISLFALSNFLPKLLSIILIPIYTRCLSTAEYGISDLIATTVSLVLPIFTLDIQDAVLRYSMDNKYNKKDVFSISIKISLISFIILSLICILIKQFNILNIKNSYLIFFLITYVSNTIWNNISLFCKGIDEIKTVAIGGIIISVSTLFFNILFLTILNLGLNGYLLANCIGMILSILFVIKHAKLHKYLQIKTSKNTLKSMIKYSFPLIFSGIAWWINNASDRYMVSYILGISISGLYAAAYKIPNILAVFQNIFFQAWSISAIKEFDKEDKDGFIGKMFSLLNMSVVIISSLLMIFNIIIVKILFSTEFYDAWFFVPPLLISVVFNAMSLFIGSIFTAVKDTKTLSYSTIIGAITNIICNLIFIKRFGAYGAAIATLISYFIVLIIRQILLKKYIILKTNLKKEYLVYVLLIAQMILCKYGFKYIIFEIIILLLILILYSKQIKYYLTEVYKYLKNNLSKNRRKKIQ